MMPQQGIQHPLTPIFGSYQHIGGRKNLEDRLHARALRTAGGLQLTVALVADGIGGQNFGEVAAELTIQATFTTIEAASTYQSEQIPQLLKNALEEANQVVIQEARKDLQKQGMGTTATLLAIHENQLYVANVGDSRAYLIRNNKAIQLTRDHTWSREMVHLGRLSPQEADAHPKAEELVRSIGYERTVSVDMGLYFNGDSVENRALRHQGLSLEPNDRLLVCSDGLIKQRLQGKGHFVETSEIIQICSKYAPDDAAKRLVEKALKRKSDDNVSAIVLSIPHDKATRSRSIWPVIVGILLLLLIGGGASIIFGDPLGLRTMFSTDLPVAAATNEATATVDLLLAEAVATIDTPTPTGTPSPEPTEMPTVTVTETAAPTSQPTSVPAPTVAAIAPTANVPPTSTDPVPTRHPVEQLLIEARNAVEDMHHNFLTPAISAGTVNCTTFLNKYTLFNGKLDEIANELENYPELPSNEINTLITNSREFENFIVPVERCENASAKETLPTDHDWATLNSKLGEALIPQFAPLMTIFTAPNDN